MSGGFKDIIRQDNRTVFLNPDEFGEEHVIGGRRMRVIIDNNEMVDREKRKAGPEIYRQGIYKKEILFYVSGQEFGPLPAVGRMLMVDKDNYIVTDAINEDGIYSISLEAVRQ